AMALRRMSIPTMSRSLLSRSMSSQSPITSSSEEATDSPSLQNLCFIGLGSNLESASGSSLDTVLAAAQRLASLSAEPVLLSSLWETTPVDCPPGSPRFVNAVAGILPVPAYSRDAGGAFDLLHALQAIEADFGRVRNGQVNAPRPLDVDMLCWGDLVLQTPELTMPHPRMLERRFVLEPLSQIAPQLVVPGCTGPVTAVLAQLPTQGEIQLIK